MERSAASFLVVGLVIGVLAGYGVGFVTYQPRVTELEADYESLSTEYEEFKAEIVAYAEETGERLFPMLDLYKQIIKMWVHLERGEQAEFNATLYGLESYVEAAGDVEMWVLWNDFLTHYNAEEYVEAFAKLADLVERNSLLIQNLFIRVSI